MRSFNAEEVVVFLVHLVLREPEGQLGDVMGEVVGLYAEEVLERDTAVSEEGSLAAIEPGEALEDSVFEGSSRLWRRSRSCQIRMQGRIL